MCFKKLIFRPQKMKAVGEPGWLVTHRTASSIPKKVLPLSALILNLPSVQNKNPSLLSFDQVKTLFGKVNVSFVDTQLIMFIIFLLN